MINLKLKFIAIFIIFNVVIFAASISEALKTHTVQIQQIEGMEIYIGCEPVDTFEVLGQIKAAGMVLSDKPDAMAKHMVKRAKKTYNTATGIILNLNDDLQTGKVIKHK